MTRRVSLATAVLLSAILVAGSTPAFSQATVTRAEGSSSFSKYFTVWCVPDVVYVEGTSHWTYRLVRTPGGAATYDWVVHVEFVGEGLLTGSEYVGRQRFVDSNDSGGNAWVVHGGSTLHLISKGSAPNLRAGFFYHGTMDADGHGRNSVGLDWLDCK